MEGEAAEAPSIQRDRGLSSSVLPRLFEWTAFSVNEQKRWPRIRAEREEAPAALSGFGLPPPGSPRLSQDRTSCLQRTAVG